MSISLRDYIKISEKNDEASVLVAENESEVSEFTKLLEDLGYFCVVDSVEVNKYFSEGKKVYGLVTEKNCGFYYTLAKDYGVGVIHLFDIQTKENITIVPLETSSFILIIRLADINNFNSLGYDFNNVCESSYRKSI